MEKKRYDGIDGLRIIACVGIVMMHVRANNSYDISGFVYDRLIGSFTNFYELCIPLYGYFGIWNVLRVSGQSSE